MEVMIFDVERTGVITLFRSTDSVALEGLLPCTVTMSLYPKMYSRNVALVVDVVMGMTLIDVKTNKAVRLLVVKWNMDVNE